MINFVSGIRPTGRIHLGNYLGAIRQWKENDGTYFVADMHASGDAIKTQQQLARLGLNAIIESDHKGEILEIQHLLSRHVGVGRLERMTQYKDKCETEQATLALLQYPVLMAADIFYFQGSHVPVGNDQIQHVEFARDMTDIMAHNGYEFIKPMAVLSEYPRIMSLTDGTKKMSKSIGDGCIFVDDTADTIRAKVQAAKTAGDIRDDTPEMQNLRTIYQALGGKEEHSRFKQFKDEIAERIICEFQDVTTTGETE